MTEVADNSEHPLLREAPLPSRSAIARTLLNTAACGALLFSVLGLAGRWHWMLDLCNHFRFQYALILLVTTLGLLLLRRWRIAILSSMGLALNLFFLLPLYQAPSPIAKPDGPAIRIMHFNVHTANTNHAGVIDEIHRHEPDLLFVQEINPTWLNALKAGLIDYDLIAARPRSDNFGIACFAKPGSKTWAIENPRIIQAPADAGAIPFIELTAHHHGRALAIRSIHPLPPVSFGYASARDALLKQTAQWASQQQTPCIVVGDLNATPWSTAFRDFQTTSQLLNSQTGFGQAPTWPAGIGTLGMIPIDHLLHSPSLITINRTIGDNQGSDHSPLIVELGWR